MTTNTPTTPAPSGHSLHVAVSIAQQVGWAIENQVVAMANSYGAYPTKAQNAQINRGKRQAAAIRKAMLALQKVATTL